MKFIEEMDEDSPCRYLTANVKPDSFQPFCDHDDMMNKVWKHKLCKGDLRNRPEWCPLVEYTEVSCDVQVHRPQNGVQIISWEAEFYTKE